MPNPGIMPGSMPAWLWLLVLAQWAAKQTPGQRSLRNAPETSQNLSTTADLDFPFTVWPIQPAWRGWSAKTRGMRAQAGTASSGKGSQKGFRNGLVTHMARSPTWLQRCKKHSAMPPPTSSHQGKTWERLALWAGLAQLQSLGVSLMNFPSQ